MFNFVKSFLDRLRQSATFKVALVQILTAAGAYFGGQIDASAFGGAVVFALLQFVQREFKLRKAEGETNA